ncbi:MAG TPA: M15 family metallopeptidase [Gammaproteobacteria bacterium]|nr:M15 family metallopeptidase [Gammaproteobacteria bacterium]
MQKTLLFLTGFMIMFNCHANEKIVLIADPKVLVIPIHENHDPMIDLIAQKEISYGPPPLLPDNTNYTKIRKTIYDKLIKAQAMLPDGLHFRLYEGYRSLDLQQKIFDERYNKLLKEHPALTHQQIFLESTKFVSPVINLDGSTNVPPHSTGAAIDVYLVDKKGNVVDMGIHLDDTYEDLKGIFCKTDSEAISEKAREYRKIMGKVLETVGFVNYPTEYWHWSYGDRYWAYQTHRAFAIYGTV